MERNEIIKKLLRETISIDIKVGDVVLGGKFKNKRITVKDIGKNDKGEVTINGKPLMRFRLTDEKPLKENEDLDFLDSYWKRAKDIGGRISSELPKTGENFNKISTNFGTTSYSNLDSKWSVNDLFGSSENLTALANKISHMIQTGKADSIKRMIESIVTGDVKTLYHISKPNQWDGNKRTKSSLGKGHFRWNSQAYTLTPKEIQIVKNYFGMNNINEGLNLDKQSPESWFENILDNVEFNNGIFSSGIKTIMKYNSNTQTLLIDINTIYTTLKEKFGLSNGEITKLIRRSVTQKFDLGGIIADVRLMS
jgi:hypothetical protein